MPNRILKESICTSDSVDALSSEAENFFYRLIVQCDDFGRFDARPSVLRARCYPLRLDRVTDADVSRWLHELVTTGTIVVYQVDGKPFLQFVSWDEHQQVRAKRSKFPRMLSDDSNGNHLLSSDDKCPRNPIQSESESESNTITRADGRGVRPTRSSHDDLARIATAHEEVLGQMLTPGAGDSLWDLLSEEGFSADWIVDAMRIAKDAGVPTMRYTKGILKRWRTEGKQERANGNNPEPKYRYVEQPDGSMKRELAA